MPASWPTIPECALVQATQISPWVVTLEALAPYEVEAPPQVGAALSYTSHPSVHAGPAAYGQRTVRALGSALPDPFVPRTPVCIHNGAPSQEPAVLPYLDDSLAEGRIIPGPQGAQVAGAGAGAARRVTHDITLSVDILPSGSSSATRICETNLRYM